MNNTMKMISFDEYSATRGCHKSALKHVQTAKHLFEFEQQKSDTDALRFGKIFHEAVFDDSVIAGLEVYSEQDWIPKSDHPEKLSINDQKAAWKAGRELYFANEQERENMIAMVKAIHEHPLAGKYLKGDGDIEPSFFWTDPRTGLACKTRFDFLRKDDIAVEIKTDVDPSPQAFGQKAYKMNYHVGAWFNREGFKAVTGRDLAAFVFVVVEKSAPYSVGVYIMGSDDFEAGELDGVSQMMRYKHIKEGGLQDHNQLDDGTWDVLPLATPKWVQFELDGDGDIDAPAPESEGGEL